MLCLLSRATPVLVAVLIAPPANGQQNECNSGGRGEGCTSSADCESNNPATICASDTFQVSCADAFGDFSFAWSDQP